MKQPRHIRAILTLVLLAATCRWVSAGPWQAIGDTGPSETSSAVDMPWQIQAGNVEVRLDVTPLQVQVAEPIELRLDVDAPVGTSVTMPEPGESLGPFQVTDQRRIDAIPIDGQTGRRRWTLLLSLESLDSGTMAVPAMEVRYQLKAGQPSASAEKTVQTEPVKMVVKSLLGDEPDLQAFREIKGAIASPETETQRGHLLPIVIVATAALGLTGAAILWTRRRRGKPIGDWALAEVEAIESQVRESTLSERDAYTELSRVLRVFFEHQFGFPATAQSGSEIRHELADRSVPNAILANVTQFLLDADEIRFSGRPRSSSGEDDTQRPSGRAREIIQAIAAASTIPADGE